MTTFAGSEAVVAALLTRLRAELDGQIATINAAVTDGFTLTVPDHTSQILDYVPSDGDMQVGFPLIGVQDFPDVTEDDTGFSITGVYQHGLLVFETDATTEGLTRKLRRWQRAVKSAVLTSGGQPSRGFGTVFSAQHVRTIPGPTIEHPTEPQTWVSWTCVVFELKTDES